MKIKDSVKKLKPYFVDEKEVPYRLDANESPYDLPESLKDNILRELAHIELNRYPDASLKILRKLVAKKEGVSEDNIIFGNGSDEFIYMLNMCLKRRSKVSYPKPGFAMYEIVSSIFEMELKPFNLTEPFFCVNEEELEKILKEGVDLIFLGNPNNPTGNLFPKNFLDRILALKDTIVVSDEAYFDYAGETLLPLIKNHKNLLIMRSFSKIGFASIRLGYMVGHANLIGLIEKVRSPYNINSFTQLIATYCFKHKDVFDNYIKSIVNERERVFKELKSMGIFVLPSKANFLTFKIDKEGFYDFLLENGVKIKDLSRSFGMKNFYRLTIGKDKENDIVLQLIKTFFES